MVRNFDDISAQVFSVSQDAVLTRHFNVACEQQRPLTKLQTQHDRIVVARRQIWTFRRRRPQDLRGYSSNPQHIASANEPHWDIPLRQSFRNLRIFLIFAGSSCDQSSAHSEVASYIVQAVDMVCIGVRRQDVVDMIKSSPPEIFRDY